jgi:putative ABC transport system ATP-binding protein
MELIDSVSEAGCTIVMVTHEKDIAAHARREISMLDGKIV